MDLYELIIWGLVALAAWVLQVAKSRQARKVEAPPAPAPQTLAREAEVPEDLASGWGRGPAGVDAEPPGPWEWAQPVKEAEPAATALPAAPALAPAAVRQPQLRPQPVDTGRTRRPLFDPRRDTRAAVIGQVVLGPCRAMAPYEGPPGSA